MRRDVFFMLTGLMIVMCSACSGVGCPTPSGPSNPLPLGTFDGQDRDGETRVVITDNSVNLSGEAFSRVDGAWQKLGAIGGLNADPGEKSGPLITVQPKGPVFDGIYNEGIFRGNTLSRDRECLGSFRFELIE